MFERIYIKKIKKIKRGGGGGVKKYNSNNKKRLCNIIYLHIYAINATTQYFFGRGWGGEGFRPSHQSIFFFFLIFFSVNYVIYVISIYLFFFLFFFSYLMINLLCDPKSFI